MAVRLGVGISALVLVMGASASATADELSPDLANLEVTGESASPSKAKEPSKAKAADGAEPQAEEPKAKKGPKDGEQVAQVTQGTGTSNTTLAAQADEGEEEEEKDDRLPPRVPWRGTAIAWDNSVTTTALGIGDDFQSDAHQTYVQSFSLGLNYFLIDQDKWSLAVASTPSFSVELTDSGTTTTRSEPWFNDLPVGLAYRRTLHSDADLLLATGLVLNGTMILPTSPGSYNAGTYLTTSPRVTLFQTIPLFGNDAPVLQSFALGASFRWDHRFGAATTPVFSDSLRPQQNLGGESFASDDLAFNRISQNTLREGVFAFFSENIGPTQLQVFGSFSFTQSYLPEYPDVRDDGTPVCVDIPTGCAPIESGPDAETTMYGYGFAVGATFFPVPELGVSLAYSNASNQLGEDGQRRSILYSPAAQFSAGLALSLDAIYEAITGPRRSSPFFLIAKNEKKNDKNERERQSPTQAAIRF